MRRQVMESLRSNVLPRTRILSLNLGSQSIELAEFRARLLHETRALVPPGSGYETVGSVDVRAYDFAIWNG